MFFIKETISLTDIWRKKAEKEFAGEPEEKKNIEGILFA